MRNQREQNSAVERFDGTRLTARGELRVMRAETLAGRVADLQRGAGEISAPSSAAERYGQMAELLRALTDSFSLALPEGRRLERFRSEKDLSRLRNGAVVVFMGFDLTLHRGGLAIVAESFDEEGLKLGEGYQVAELPGWRRRESFFAIRGPSGEKLYLDFTYFGQEKDGSEDFVNEWAMT